MIIFEFKAYGQQQQFQSIDEAIRTTQFVRNKCLRLWIEGGAKSCFDLNKYCAVLAKEFPFADKLNSQARQSAAERAWAAISRFYENCKKKVSGKKAENAVLGPPQVERFSKKGFPSFQKDNRSVEYKTTGWKLSEDRKSITFTDGNGIGKLKMKGTRDLNFYQPEQIKRVRLVKRADGYYVQFCIAVDRQETLHPTGRTIGSNSQFRTGANFSFSA
jgi:putative transposase